MTNENYNHLLKTIKENLKPGITVALVSIPLSIAISIASGAGPVPGIITGFWATIIASFFGGSKYNIIGPAGALTSVLFAATAGGVVGLAGPAVLPIIALFTGLIIFIIYLMRGERYIRYIPASVVHGFAAGVAITIASTQLREAFGIVEFFKAKGEFIHDFENIILNIPNTHISTFLTFLTFFVFLVVWKKYVKSIPGVMPATIAGILLGYLSKHFGFLDGVKTIGDRYGDLSLSLLQLPNFGVFNQILSNPETLLSIIKVSAVVAVIAILETLITAKIGDKLTGTRFDVRKETRGLALSNLGSGLFGGLPATGVFIRTGLNIKSGATEKYSGVIAGLITGLGALICMPFIKYIPMSVISAMLMMTAIGLIEVQHFKHIFNKSKKDFYIAIITVGLVLAFDPGVAVLVGTVAALMYLLEKTTDGTSEISLFKHNTLVKRINSRKIEEANINFSDTHVDTVVYSIGGFLSYVDAEQHLDNILTISNIDKVKKIGIRMRNMDYADFEALEELAQVVNKIEHKNIKVFLSSVNEQVLKELREIKTFKDIESRGMIFSTTGAALA